MIYRFIEKNRQQYSIERLCQVLGIARSAYYGWKKRGPSQRDLENRALIEHIRRIHKLSRKAYGSPRVYYQLKKQGLTCSPKRVARLMRQDGLKGRRKYRKVRTTDSRHIFSVAENLLNREFRAENRTKSGSPISLTYQRTKAGYT